MSAPEQEINPYELLDVKQESTEQEIRTAYRQRSLKVHPDRNPNNPDAARKFHELNQAYELLLDPLRRLALDAKLRIKQARTERFKSYDNKRKNLVEELEERERAFKKARMEKQKEEAQSWQSNEKIKEDGKRLREEREKALRTKLETEAKEKQDDAQDLEAPPPMGSMDTTVRIKYPFKTYPQLTSPESVSAFLSRFGSTDESSIVMSTSLKGKKDKSEKLLKTGTALVPFKQIGDAFAAVCASERKDLGLNSVKITWVKGEEPAILGWLRRMGKLGRSTNTSSPMPGSSSSSMPIAESKQGLKAGLPQNQKSGSSYTPFSSFPLTMPEHLPASLSTTTAPAVAIDYESLTLMRLRQAERERLEREILEQEAKEG